MIYTKANCKRILESQGFSVLWIMNLRVSETEVCVTFKNDSNKTQEHSIPVKKFGQMFAHTRREEGRKLACRQVGDGYKVASSQGGEYFVELLSTGPVCRCADYVEQIGAWGSGVCKHGYAVLMANGFESLADYLAAQSKTA